jgi:hypothetical protein
LKKSEEIVHSKMVINETSCGQFSLQREGGASTQKTANGQQMQPYNTGATDRQIKM